MTLRGGVAITVGRNGLDSVHSKEMRLLGMKPSCIDTGFAPLSMLMKDDAGAAGDGDNGTTFES
jgi:hypothetical protein